MNVLSRIFAQKAEEVARAKESISPERIEVLAHEAGPTRGFLRALANAPTSVALIAEVKKASPSKGIIRPDFDAREVALAYADVGAHALSVLTDEEYFKGSAENLRVAREVSGLPCLRKDFINQPYQVYQSRSWGADAILLIASALEFSELVSLQDLAHDLGMDVLVEVHTHAEMEMALAAECPLIGVNNRNLGDFTTDIEASERLIPLISPYALAVSESALTSVRDIERVALAGARAVLIGSAFCAAPDIRAKVREVMGW